MGLTTVEFYHWIQRREDKDWEMEEQTESDAFNISPWSGSLASEWLTFDGRLFILLQSHAAFMLGFSRKKRELLFL